MLVTAIIIIKNQKTTRAKDLKPLLCRFRQDARESMKEGWILKPYLAASRRANCH